jgi:hypothetical protein
LAVIFAAGLGDFMTEIVDVGKTARSVPCFTKEGLVAISFLLLCVKEYLNRIAQQGNLIPSMESFTKVAATSRFSWHDTNSKGALTARHISVTHVFRRFSPTK